MFSMLTKLGQISNSTQIGPKMSNSRSNSVSQSTNSTFEFSPIWSNITKIEVESDQKVEFDRNCH
jgi:hypothetical protein